MLTRGRGAAAGVAAVLLATSAAVAADERSPDGNDLDKARGWLAESAENAGPPPRPAAAPDARFAPPPLKFDDAGIARWVADHANLEGWVRVSFSNQVVAFVQQDKPELGDWPLVRAQVRYDSFAPTEHEPYPSQRGDMQFDCSRDRLRYLSWEIYREPGLKGGVVSGPEFDAKAWTYPQPYTIERDLVVHVCDWVASLREAR